MEPFGDQSSDCGCPGLRVYAQQHALTSTQKKLYQQSKALWSVVRSTSSRRWAGPPDPKVSGIAPNTTRWVAALQGTGGGHNLHGSLCESATGRPKRPSIKRRGRIRRSKMPSRPRQIRRATLSGRAQRARYSDFRFTVVKGSNTKRKADCDDPHL